MTGPLSGWAGITRSDPGSAVSAGEDGLSSARLAVTEAYEAGIEDWIDETLIRFRDQIDEFAQLDQPEIWDEVRRQSIGTRRWQARFVAAGRLPSAITHESEIGGFAARLGISLEAVLRAYKIGGSWSWQAWMAAMQAPGMEPDEYASCLESVTRLVRDYEELMLASVVDGYREAELDRSPATVRLRSVRAFLDGFTEDLEGVNYPLHWSHIGVIAWEGDAAASLRRAGAAVGADQIVTPPVTDGESVRWCWFGVDRSKVDAMVDALRGLDLAGTARLAVGRPSPGPEGFRRTHRQAGVVYSIARRTERVVTTYPEVALEALALADESAARDFVVSELGSIAAADQRSARLRLTLDAYLRAGHNASVAAARIGVHEQTVTRRLHVIAERLGESPVERSAELQLALRLYPLLAGGLADGGDGK